MKTCKTTTVLKQSYVYVNYNASVTILNNRHCLEGMKEAQILVFCHIYR